MSPDSSVQVVVDLERSAQTITGQITVAGAGTAAFFGWLELIDRLERAVDAHDGRRSHQHSPAPNQDPEDAMRAGHDDKTGP